jgi:hypothetical protein
MCFPVTSSSSLWGHSFRTSADETRGAGVEVAGDIVKKGQIDSGADADSRW